MNGRETSDPAIVARKPTNAAGRPAAEAVERRAGAEGNAGRQSTLRTQIRERVTQALDRILEDGVVRVSDKGTGQGSVVSPLLANVYLHYVLDLWAERWRRREATGDMIIVRYADDVVAGFEHETDARRFLDALTARFAEVALSLHPEKTRLIEFGRHAAAKREKRGLGKPETFNFLGFTLICGKSRAGGFLLKRKSRRDRVRAKLKEVKEELRRRMHHAIPDQGRWLRQVVSGFFAYHAVPTNSRAVVAFRHHVTDLWRRTLRRRSQTDATTWQRIKKIADDFLPEPRVLHPWPNQRFAVNHPRWEPYAGKLHVRFCAGGARRNARPYRDPQLLPQLPPQLHRNYRQPTARTRQIGARSE
jgi:RNA-directed DNA polymerase